MKLLFTKRIGENIAMSKNTIFKLFKSKKIYLLVFVALIGVLLVFFGSRKSESAETVTTSIRTVTRFRQCQRNNLKS